MYYTTVALFRIVTCSSCFRRYDIKLKNYNKLDKSPTGVLYL